VIAPPDIDGYVIEAYVAAGGMGHVFRARDAVTGDAVAIKVLAAPDAAGHRALEILAERFSREARVLARLTSGGIARYRGHGTTKDGVPYVATEWVEGETLASRLERGPLSVGEAVVLGARLARTLGAAHDLGVVHRDVKPSNVMLVEGGVERAKLIDFGIAREPSSEMTTVGIAIGTHGYMSPEQARGAREVDARSDVFALGCVLFRALGERLPFEGAEGVSLMGRILFEEAPGLDEIAVDVPEPLARLIQRMLAKDPSRRPADGASVAAALEAIDLAGYAPPSAPRPSRAGITSAELKLVQVLAGLGLTDGERDAAREILASRGARVQWLANGTCLASFVPNATSSDRAHAAARAALALREIAPRAALALATGRAEITRRLPVGEALAAAVAMLAEGRPGEIRIDEVTTALLESRFEITRTERGAVVTRERQEPQTARSLLGRPTPLVGRDRELGLLRALLAECREEPVARVVLITAPAGIGKSRLRSELLREVDDVTVWVARGDPVAAGAPFGMARQLVRAAAGGADLRGYLQQRLSAAEAERAADFLGELVGRPPGDESAALRAARQDALLMRDQVQRAWEDLLAAECDRQPLVVVLDDLHWGDAPSARLVDGALLRMRDRPLFVLGLARPEVTEALPGLWAGRGVHHIELAPLGRGAAGRLVRQTLDEAATDDVVARIVQLADGNAFHLEELVRATIERGAGALPATVVAMLQARLGAIDADARLVLRAASVFGLSFQAQGVAAVLGRGATLTDVRERLGQLVDLEFLHRGAVPDELSFRHPLLREAAYAMLTDADRRTGHKLAGAWLEQSSDGSPLVIAEHLERGGEARRAARHYVLAAEQSLEGEDLDNALARAARAVEAGASGEDLGRAKLVAAQARRWRGEFADAAGAARDAQAALTPGSDRWFRAAGELGWAMGILGDVDGIVGLAEALLTADAPSPRTAARAVALTQLVPQLVRSGRVELADLVLASVRDEAVGDPYARAQLHHALAARRTYAGDPLAYLEEMRAAAEASDRVGDGRGACLARAHLGYGLVSVGAFEEGERVLAAALDEADRKGLTAAAASARSNLGLALALVGRLDEARRFESDAADVGAQQNNPRFEAAARLYLARIHLLAGDLDAAEREARRAVSLPPRGAPLLGWAKAALAEVLLARRRDDEALACAREGHDLCRARGGVLEGETTVHLVYARALHRCGHEAEAKEEIAHAARRLVQRADAFADAAMRARFLERIPENRATLELARAWGV
jgi:tetratricopeptide (TPR) repeat protein